MSNFVENMRSIFRQSAQNPGIFHMDVPRVDNNDILQNREIREKIQKQGDIVVVTSENLRGALADFVFPRHIQTPDFYRGYDLSNTVQNFVRSKTPEELNALTERFYTELEVHNPKIREQIQNIKAPTISWLVRDLGNQIDVRALSVMAQILIDKEKYKYASIKNFGLHFVSVPVGAAPDEVVDFLNKPLREALGDDKNYSGFDRQHVPEYIALITLHELAHALDGGQETTVGATKEVIKDRLTEGARGHMIIADEDAQIWSANELDAYLEELMSLASVSEETARKMAAQYIVTAHKFLWYNAHSSDLMSIGDTHDKLGYLGMECFNTGHLPNYAELTKTVNGFYAQTKDFYFDQLKRSGVPITNIESMPRPSVQAMMGIVQDALKTDPPIYSPAQQMMAQHFIEATRDTLKVAPVSMGRHINQVVEDYREFLNIITPSPTQELRPIKAH